MADKAPGVPRLYVSAPNDIDLRPLLDGLKRRGTEPYVLSDVAPLGAEILQSLRLAIERADRVLVVLGDAPAPNPMFEAGFALAFGKPLLIIAAPGATVPTDLAGQVIARARPDDLDAINFALDQVQQRAPLGTRRTPGPTGRPLRPDVVDRLLDRLSASASTDGSSIAILAEAIEASGEVAVANTGRDAGFDLGVWSDDLEAIGGNPLLVEMKRSLVPGAVDQVLRGPPQRTSRAGRVSRAGGWGSATVTGRARPGPVSRFGHLTPGAAPTHGFGQFRRSRSRHA